MQYISDFIGEFTYLFMEMAPWLLLGFLFAGMIHVYMPPGVITKYMGGRKLKSVIYAALLGIPLPLCSCGVIPTGISFHKEGASKGATVSFLISTPQTGIDSILATYSLLGLPFAILRPVVAFFSGIFGGSITNVLTRNEPEMPQIKENKRSVAPDKKGRLWSMFRYAYYDFLMDIARWLIMGLFLAALISVVLPDGFFTLYLESEWISMLIVLAAAVPLYVCATGSIPIAAVLMMKGLSPGAALVFLMAGPAVSAATIAVIGHSIDRKTHMTYLMTIVVSALFFGFLTNQFMPREWFTGMISHHAYHEHEMLPDWLRLASGFLLGFLLIGGYALKFMKKRPISKPEDTHSKEKIMTVTVTGMTCSHCKATVENGLRALAGVASVNADPEQNLVTVSGSGIEPEQVRKTIESCGFGFRGIIN